MLSEIAPNVGSHHVHLAMLLEAVRVEESVPVQFGRGRKARHRCAIARSFVVKAYLNFASTKQFRQVLVSDDALRALCGFWGRVPSESAFSRAFAFLAEVGFGDLVQMRLIQVHESQTLAIDVARDSSAIVGREKPLKKKKKVKVAKLRRKPGPKKKGEPPAQIELTRIQRQLDMDPEEALLEIPTACDFGMKRGSKGDNYSWVGYKLHADVLQDGMPVSLFLSSASVHDNQLAIPLMKTTSKRVGAVFYQLMDAGYVGEAIPEAARRLGQVPIIAPKATPTRKAIPLDEDRQVRFRGRTVVERFFSDLKDNRGANHVRVRGPAKVHLHIMFGVLSIMGAILLTR